MVSIEYKSRFFIDILTTQHLSINKTRTRLKIRLEEIFDSEVMQHLPGAW